MVTLSDEQREEIAAYGTPLPIIEAEEGKAYILMPVKMDRTRSGVFRAVVPCMNAVGDGDVPSEAVFALCAAIEAATKAFGS